jgi:penicillin-binding protein 1B
MLRIALRVVLGVVVVAAIALGFYIAHLDRIVTKQFEGRRWTLPAQVFASPLELYAGLPLAGADIEKELQRLQYRRVDQLVRPGTYRKRGDRIDVALRAARFADEARPAQVLSILATDEGITGLRDSTGKEVPVVRFEPLLIGSIFPIHGEDRIVVTPQDVPSMLPEALKAVEDRKFDSHHGVNPTAIMRAMWINFRAGEIEQGGSTLTQQLVKSYFLDSRRTASRKAREALMAICLEAHFSKSDLMNAYINEIHLGQDGNRAVHGFGLASEFYFGKPLSELDLAEVATLVAIARGPSYYEPRRHPERARSRRDLVLKIMAEQEIITAQQAREASRQPLGVTARSSSGYYPAYLDLVRRTLRRDYRDEDLTEAGLKIFTSLDPRVQDRAEQTLEKELTRLDKASKRKDKKKIKLEGAIVVTTPQSGDVIAVVGGRDAGYQGFNRALDAKRPMGSLVKPFVFLAALETGRYNATTVVEDAPLEIKLARGKKWRPENYTKQTYGPVPLVRALADSLNLATVSVGMDVGLDSVTRTLERFGLEQDPQKVPSILLGSVDASPLEIAQLYNGLANGGFRTPLRAVRAVISGDGKPLKAFPVEVVPVAEADAVYQVDQMMEQVMLRGTGRSARSILPPDLAVAGKSGTSSDLRDSWFAGFSGSHVAVVWVGYDDNQVTGFTGSSGALPVWSKLMAQLGTTSWSAPMPESLQEIWMEYQTGLRAEPGCAEELISIAIPQGVEPPMKPGCGGTTIDSLVERASTWIRDLVN